MAEYARLTGHPEMPPLWSLGYQQSHRTLASREEVLSIARTFREKKLPCDALIYLGHRILPLGLEHRPRVVHVQPIGVPRPQGDARRAARDALPRRAARRHPRRGRSRGRVERSASSPDATDEDASRQLLERPSRGLRPGRGRLVARRGRPARRPLAAGPDPDVLGRPAARPARRAALRPAPQRLRGHAALRGVPLVGRRLLDLGDLEDPRAGRDQHGADGHPLLGHRHRRLRPDQGADGRALRPLVPVRRVLPALPLARPDLEAPAALGLEHRRARARTRSAATATPPIPAPTSCTTPPSSRSAASTSSCATA